MIKKSLKYLRKLQTEQGLFRASNPDVTTGYDRIWIRDNVYIGLAFEAVGDSLTAQNLYHGLLDLFIKFEAKIDDVIEFNPPEDYKRLHPLYTEDLEEVTHNWGWVQNDAIGAVLFKIGQLETSMGGIIRNDKDKEILQKLVRYMEAISYWKDKDNGMWEESKEIHSSSIAACVAGLKEMKLHVEVPKDLILKGESALTKLLPRESKTKSCDLSQLSIVYPYNLLDTHASRKLTDRIASKLQATNGIIRYRGDNYYKKNNIEASWSMGYPWLAICYYMVGDMAEYKRYLHRSLEVLNDDLEMPELFIEGLVPNENCPLGWSQSMLIVALSL